MLSSLVLTGSANVKDMFRKIRIHGKLLSGYRQVIRTVERGEAKLVFLANDCNEANYKSLINAICKSKGVHVSTKFSRKELGELSGQFRLKGPIDEQRMGKVHLASTAVIISFGPMRDEEVKSFESIIN